MRFSSDLDLDEVERITGAKRPHHSWDPCISFPNGISYAQLEQLVGIGAADMDDAQNDSPSIGDFLRELIPYKDSISFIGYVVYPPRTDTRVSVEGFEAKGVTAEIGLDLAFRYKADETGYKKNEDGTFDLSFWWD